MYGVASSGVLTGARLWCVFVFPAPSVCVFYSLTLPTIIFFYLNLDYNKEGFPYKDLKFSILTDISDCSRQNDRI